MSRSKLALSRRGFLQQAAVGAAVATIVPRNVVGQGQTPPSEEFWGALIGAGGRGGTTFKTMGPGIRLLAQCDVKFLDRADDKRIYTDYRRVLERNDIDVVAIATPPHWHALISAAAMEAFSSNWSRMDAAVGSDSATRARSLLLRAASTYALTAARWSASVIRSTSSCSSPSRGSGWQPPGP